MPFSEAEPVQEIEYSLSLGDLDAFLRYSAKNTEESWLWFLGLFLGLGLLLLACMGFPGGGTDAHLTPLLGALVFCLLVLLGKKWAHSLTSLRPVGRDVEKFLAERRLRVSPQGLTHATEFAAETVSWKAVDRIAVITDYAFLFSSQRAAYILPKRAFVCDEDFQGFVRLAKHYHSCVTARSEDTLLGQRALDQSEHIRPSH
jgi:hypothetical protein